MEDTSMAKSIAHVIIEIQNIIPTQLSRYQLHAAPVLVDQRCNDFYQRNVVLNRRLKKAMAIIYWTSRRNWMLPAILPENINIPLLSMLVCGYSHSSVSGIN